MIMKVCCSNPECFNAGKVFDDSVLIEDTRKRRICNVCRQSSLVPSTIDAHCSGCKDDCDTMFLQKFYKIHDRKDICCCEGCLARTLLDDQEIDLTLRRARYPRVSSKVSGKPNYHVNENDEYHSSRR
jgi:hypothetical protein